jgi:hypothetical protein
MPADDDEDLPPGLLDDDEDADEVLDLGDLDLELDDEEDTGPPPKGGKKK